MLNIQIDYKIKMSIICAFIGAILLYGFSVFSTYMFSGLETFDMFDFPGILFLAFGALFGVLFGCPNEYPKCELCGKECKNGYFIDGIYLAEVGIPSGPWDIIKVCNSHYHKILANTKKLTTEEYYEVNGKQIIKSLKLLLKEK